MKADEITIEMKANLKVDRETAETCLKLVEMYVNQNEALEIIGDTEVVNGVKYTKYDFCTL